MNAGVFVVASQGVGNALQADSNAANSVFGVGVTKGVSLKGGGSHVTISKATRGSLLLEVFYNRFVGLSTTHL